MSGPTQALTKQRAVVVHISGPSCSGSGRDARGRMRYWDFHAYCGPTFTLMRSNVYETLGALAFAEASASESRENELIRSLTNRPRLPSPRGACEMRRNHLWANSPLAITLPCTGRSSASYAPSSTKSNQPTRTLSLQISIFDRLRRRSESTEPFNRRQKNSTSAIQVAASSAAARSASALVRFSETKEYREIVLRAPVPPSASLEAALNPRLWTKEQSDAWHQHISIYMPDVQAGFDALRATVTKSGE
jgi:hypothetical protein